MSIEDIIHAWKSGEEALRADMPACPVGRELDEQELQMVAGGGCCPCNTCCTDDCGLFTDLSTITTVTTVTTITA